MAAYCSNYFTFSWEKYFQFPQTQTMTTVEPHIETNKLLPQLNTVHRQRISERDRDRETRNKQGVSSTPKKKEKNSVRLIHRQSHSCEPRTAAGSSKRPPETKPKTAREKPGNQILKWNCEREGEEKEDFNAENQSGTSNNVSELLCELYFSKR